MVLHAKVCGRVGSCQALIKATFRNERGLFRFMLRFVWSGRPRPLPLTLVLILILTYPTHNHR